MKKLFTGLLTLLCVFGVQTIPMNAKENSNDNSTQNTNNNKDNKQDTNGDYGISLCSGNKGKK
ncbi:hypothetical protein LLE98_10380 [Holdemanella porci]|jgi:hypothetical protein|uniref:hypothetical protein n=1 Tax=Holdemanella porci TaxID=2652276 RepID=UPI001D15C891|nr:hypothetical protein [Holdemanella porci]MCC3361736.1 hypothetical protein [Holdemanella porci]